MAVLVGKFRVVNKDHEPERIYIQAENLEVCVNATHEGVIVDVYPVGGGEVFDTLGVMYPRDEDGELLRDGASIE
jgi:hypothetical protein